VFANDPGSSVHNNEQMEQKDMISSSSPNKNGMQKC